MAARCPVCDRGHLFAGILKFRDQCDVCGADFSHLEDTGDGPAIFVIFIVGIFIAPIPVVLSLATGWPSWILVSAFAPIILGASIFFLRIFRAMLFRRQWKQQAIEQRFGPRS